jgi:GNAT superfamily N-acetyltransferase
MEYEKAIKRLQKQCLPADEPLEPSTGYWWLAWAEDGRLAGFCSLHPSRRWQDTGYLSRAGVLDCFQGHGLQKRLIKVRERLARRLGWLWLVSDTTDNPASANNLISCGFKTYSPRLAYTEAPETIYWRKRLF